MSPTVPSGNFPPPSLVASPSSLPIVRVTLFGKFILARKRLRQMLESACVSLVRCRGPAITSSFLSHEAHEVVIQLRCRPDPTKRRSGNPLRIVSSLLPSNAQVAGNESDSQSHQLTLVRPFLEHANRLPQEAGNSDAEIRVDQEEFLANYQKASSCGGSRRHSLCDQASCVGVRIGS